VDLRTQRVLVSTEQREGLPQVPIEHNRRAMALRQNSGPLIAWDAKTSRNIATRVSDKRHYAARLMDASTVKKSEFF
jgi:hypothetical protein